MHEASRLYQRYKSVKNENSDVSIFLDIFMVFYGRVRASQNMEKQNGYCEEAYRT